jgi:type III secretion protein J
MLRYAVSNSHPPSQISGMRGSAWRHALLCLCLLLAACGKQIELQQKLGDDDANAIQALFIQHGIAMSSERDKDGIRISVPQAQLPRAVALLREAGLPRQPLTNLGEMFRKDGIVSTPLEERARYIYALSQQLEGTLQQIDGVVSARVQVVLPDRATPGDPLDPSSASVLIKYRPGVIPDHIAPYIARLVADSIPGLSGHQADKVSLILVPAVLEPDPVAPQRASLRWPGERLMIAAAVALLVAAVSAAVLLSKRRQWR